MQREIKFRAWIKADKRMEMCIDVNPFHVSDCDRLYWKHDEVELMQYTGLNDAHDKEIYEGDILHHKWSSGTTILETISEVKFVNGSFVCDDKKRMDFELAIHALGKHANIEIIGNVYKNPELLQEVSHD